MVWRTEVHRVKFVALLAVIAALGWTQALQAEDPPLDFGETQPLLVACGWATEYGTDQGFIIKNCRRVAPDEIVGNRAVVHIRVMTDRGPLKLKVRFFKTQWMISTAVSER